MDKSCILDTNIIYNLIGIGNTVKYSIKSGVNWIYTDISVYEAVNKFSNCTEKMRKVIDFFKQNKERYKRFIDKSKIDPIEIINYEVDSNEYNNLVKEIIKQKKELEMLITKCFVDDFSICFMGKLVVDYKINQEDQKKYWISLYTLIQPNDLYLKGLIEKDIELFYNGNKKGSELKTNIEDKIMMFALVMIHNFISVKHGLTMDEYRKKFSENSNDIINDDLFEYVKEIIKYLNGEEIKPLVELDDDNLKIALGILEQAAKIYKEIPKGFQLYKREFLKKIFTENKKLDKNDALDALIFSRYPDYLIVTEDKNFKKIIALIDPTCLCSIDSILIQLP